MKYYEYEVLCKQIIKPVIYDIATMKPIGYYFDHKNEDYIYPKCLYFCPVTGSNNTNRRSGKILLKIENYKILKSKDIIADNDLMKQAYQELYCQQFPNAINCEHIHVFEFSDSIIIPKQNQEFRGSSIFFKPIFELLKTNEILI